MVSTSVIHVLLVDAVPDVVSWDKLLAGGSAAALIAALFVFVLKHVGTQHEKCTTTFATTVEKSNDMFASAVKEQAVAFGNTTTTLVREARESGERREKDLHDLIRETRKP